MSEERCLNCGHDALHIDHCTQCVRESGAHNPTICTDKDRTIATLRAEVERLTTILRTIELLARPAESTEAEEAGP